MFTNRTFEKMLEFLFQPGFLERNVYVFETEQLPVSIFDFSYPVTLFYISMLTF